MEELARSAVPTCGAPAATAQWVLVVEDDDDLRQLVALSIEELTGLAVRTAADGAEALGEIRRDQPALIVTDLMMPRMDGYQLCEAVREACPGLAVVAMSAAASKAAALSAGFDAYLVKPFEFEELAAVLGRWVSVR